MTLALSLGESPLTSARPCATISTHPTDFHRSNQEGTYLFCDYNIQIMLCLINVRTHWYDTAHTRGISLARPSAGRMHDAILGASQEVGAASETIQHAAAPTQG